MTTDTGTHLRSLYDRQGGVAQVFSRKVADYVASRPDYPEAFFNYLQRELALPPGALVADVAAGTGLLTRGLLERGYRVVAVEPNPEMRAAADALLTPHTHYRSVAGFAESLPLADASIDLVTVGHAFHWFDCPRAKAQCLRVLRPGGQVTLVWNDRVPSDPLNVALDAVLDAFGGAKRMALKAHEERGDVATFFGSSAPAQVSWPHGHRLDRAGLLSLVFSRSYMPARDSAQGQAAVEALQQLFDRFAGDRFAGDRFAGDGSVTMRYTTVAFIGRPR